MMGEEGSTFVVILPETNSNEVAVEATVEKEGIENLDGRIHKVELFKVF